MQIANDKLMHLSVGMLIYGTLSIFNVDLAIIMVVVAAVGKEIRDEIVYRGFDRADMLWTMLAPICLYSLELLVR